MKSIATLLFALLIGCTNTSKNFPPATSAIEAGRNYIEACLQGDFEKAKVYAATNKGMQSYTSSSEKTYRTLGKEGRANYRQASIIILDVTDQDSLHTLINYRNSMDNTPHQIAIEKVKGNWQVTSVTP
jgi:hypothetical protein